jgi:hypothetical protein
MVSNKLSMLTVFFAGLWLYSTYLSVTQLVLPGCSINGDRLTRADEIFRQQPVKSPPQTADDIIVNKPPLFNPWRDFVFTDIGGDETHYSSHSCVAAAHNDRRQDHVSRTCHYQNLYYHIPTKSWNYYPAPTERLVFRTDNDRLTDMDVALWHVREVMIDKVAKAHSVPYRPQVHLEDEIPRKTDTSPINDARRLNTGGGNVLKKNLDNRPKKITSVYNAKMSANKVKMLSMNNGMRPVFVMYQGSMANFGHFIWDDYLSIYSQLDLLDLADDDAIMPIPFVQDPPKYSGGSYCFSNSEFTYPKCAKFMKRLYPSLWNMDTDCSGDVVRTNNWLQGADMIGRWPNHRRDPCGDYRDNITNTIDAEYVLVPNVTVGSGRLALFSCYGDCTLGRGPQLFRFRNYLMRRMLGHDHATNPKGYITFSLAFGASRGAGEVTFFDDEIAAARERYGADAVRAVDFANMTLQDQGRLIADSAVLFTNHGGGSASTVFLPKGASAFVYWRGQQRDNEFYRAVAYFRTEWIEYKQRKDVDRTMRLLDMQLANTAIMYPNMICFQKDKQQSSGR